MKKLSKLPLMLKIFILLLGALAVGGVGAIWRWLTGDPSYSMPMVLGLFWGIVWVNIFLD